MKFVTTSNGLHFNLDKVEAFIFLPKGADYDVGDDRRFVQLYPSDGGLISETDYKDIEAKFSHLLFKFESVENGTDPFGYPYLTYDIALNIEKIIYFKLSHSGIPRDNSQCIYIEMESRHYLAPADRLKELEDKVNR